MLISVTNFFRDREAFEALERQIATDLFDTPPAREPLACTDDLHVRARAHVELFLRGDIVVVPAGIGIRGGRRDGSLQHERAGRR